MTTDLSAAKPGGRYEIKARSFSEILDAAFQLYRDNLQVFLATSAIIMVPVYLLVSALYMSMLGTSDIKSVASGAPMKYLMVTFATFPVYFLSHLISQAALTTAISDAYLGKPVTVGSAFGKIGTSIGTLVVASILWYLGVVAGMLLFIIPGILFALRWVFYVQAIIVEGTGPKAALSRSTSLAVGRRGRIFLLLLALGVIGLVISVGFTAVVPNSLLMTPWVGVLIQGLPQILLLPMYPAVVTLAYFDARVVKEGFDLEVLARSLGPNAPPSVGGPTAG